MSSPANAYTMNIISEIFNAFPGRFRFTSGRRTAAQNQAVGGVPNSYHVTGQAADFVSLNGQYPANEREQINTIVTSYGYELLFHNVGSGYHYHIEPSPTFNGGNDYIDTSLDSDSETPSDSNNQQTLTFVAIGLGALFLIYLWD